MKRSVSLAIAATAIAAVAIGFTLRGDGLRGDSQAAGSALQKAAPARVAHANSYAYEADPMRPDLTIARALPSARSGSAKAMRDLAQALRLCSQLQANDEEAIVREQAALAESYERFAKDNARPVDEKSLQEETTRKAEAQIQVKSICANISAADAGSWLKWLERAAAAGDMDARREFATAVLGRTRDANGLFEDIDEVARQKRLAFGFLREVLASGDCTVSDQMQLLAPSPADAYTYALVNFEWGKAMQAELSAPPKLAAENIAFMQRQLDLHAAKVPPAQQVAARVAAQRIYQRCR